LGRQTNVHLKLYIGKFNLFNYGGAVWRQHHRFATWKGLYGLHPEKIFKFSRGYHRIFTPRGESGFELNKHVEYKSNKFHSEVMTGGAVDGEGNLWFCSLKGDLLQMRSDSLLPLNS